MLSGCSWTVVVESDECVLVKINKNIDLKNLELVLKDDRRCLITKITISKRNFKICTSTNKPMFAELGEVGCKDIDKNVKYVTGSGSELYSNKI